MKQYTKKQIIESIKYWTRQLHLMDESKSPLIDAFAEKFGKEIAFNKQSFVLNNDIAYEISKILNNFLFNSSIINFPSIEVVTYGQYCKKIKSYEMTYCDKSANEIIFSKNNFFGECYVVIENDFNTLEWNDKLIYSHEIMFLNLDKLKYRSFIMNVNAICHEMIHVYDRHFGDGEGLDKYCIIKNQIQLNTISFHI